ncbi:hypothetical protein [Amycolatopsis australiensis]|uniref:Uncharacterized protein n=1 Tax=Amycolatopsis australiensis TaxID=546364 RepID=A0A1K1RJJ6_9PSEU|nr:hypothetical protein [Amycolatopsis australiensis]SFW71870.1 hypothetical protein SAMN04489730_3342 [Amycolatopsis australiensis]
MSGGFGFPVGCVSAVGAVIVADLAGATGRPWYALVALGPVVAVTAFRTSVPAALGVAVVAWALDSGFVLGRAGQLRFDTASAIAASVLASALLVGVLAAALSRVVRPVRIPAPRRPAEVPARHAVGTAG